MTQVRTALSSAMSPISTLAKDMRFRQRWEFRETRSELSSDDSLSNNYDKPKVCDSPAFPLPSPENDQWKDCSSSLKGRKAYKSEVGKSRKAKLAKKKKWRGFVNLGGMAGDCDISISNELQVHMRWVMEDLDAERQKMSTWMWEEIEKMSAKGVAPRRRGKNSVLAHSLTRKSMGRSRSQGPDEINISQVPGKDGNFGENQKAADSDYNIGQDSSSIPLDACNILVRPGGRDNLRDTSSSGTTFGISNDQSSIYYSLPNGFLNYSPTILRSSASPLLPSDSNRGVAGSRPTNPGVANAALTHLAGTITYPPTPLLVEGVSHAGGQPMENFCSNLTKSMVARFE